MPLGKLFGGRGNKTEKETPSSVPQPAPEPRYAPRKSWSGSGRRSFGDANAEPQRTASVFFGTSPKTFDIREFGRFNRDSLDSNTSGKGAVDRRVNA